MNENGSMNEKLGAALVAAQKEMPAVDKTGRSNFGAHVTLDHLIAKTRPHLAEHGLAITQFIDQTDTGQPALRTTLMHESGESLSSVMPLLLLKPDMQQLGSATTYARRYAWAAALGISSETDDDGDSIALPAREFQQGSPAADGESRVEQGAVEAHPSTPPAPTPNGGFVLKYGPHAGKTLDQVPRDYIDSYLASDKGSGFVKDKMREFIAVASPDDDIPF